MFRTSIKLKAVMQQQWWSFATLNKLEHRYFYQTIQRLKKKQFKCIIYADESLSRNDMMHMFTRMHTDLCEELYHIIWLLKSHVRHKTGKKMRDCHGYDSHLYIAQCKMHHQHLQKLYHNNLSFWNVLISISCHLHSPFWTMTVQLTKYSLWHLWFKINFPVLDTT